MIIFAPSFLDQILTALLGAFLAGTIVPREGDLSISLTEKLEDMVTIVFLPLVSVGRTCRLIRLTGLQYFTISGLNTNLGLLNDGPFC